MSRSHEGAVRLDMPRTEHQVWMGVQIPEVADLQLALFNPNGIECMQVIYLPTGI
ncbi:MAG: hypothetical protein JOZ81_33395 [Chloroflexi bacterium]|nr:hypothetical protein [Chloroflexota bacterium]